MVQAATRSKGTITLTGKWDEETINLLDTVLRAFQNIHEHAYWNDLHIEGKFSPEANELPFTAEGGLGFDFTLQLLNEFMAERIAAGRKLSKKESDAHLAAMEEKKLELTLDFTLHSNWGFQELDCYLDALDEDEGEKLRNMMEEEGYHDLETYYMCEVVDQESPEVYRKRDKKHLVLSVKNGAWALNEKVFFSYDMSPDCDMEWLIIFHVFVEESKEHERKLTHMQLVQLRNLCLQWAKENNLHYTTDYESEGLEIITWDTGGEWPLEIDEMLLRDYVWHLEAYERDIDEDGKKNVERFVERVRADLQASVDAILEKR